jgi:ketosteroid isomerase-like protein
MTTQFTQTLEQIDRAVDAAYHTDPEPYVAVWAHRPPVSLFGALGPAKATLPDVQASLRWVGTRFSDGAMSTNYEVVEVGTDLAYTVGYEQGELTLDGQRRPVRIRVTHIYRLEDGEWRLVHRHGDFAPADTSPTAENGRS